MEWMEVDDFAFHPPMWIVGSVLLLVGLLVWKLGKILVLALRG
jgi:hypothetical protein